MGNEFIILGGHLDSIAGFNSQSNSPGADDNGSGSAGLLEMARIIDASGIKFKYSIRLVLFNGEEQGLLGSRAIARRWKNEGLRIRAASSSLQAVASTIPRTTKRRIK